MKTTLLLPLFVALALAGCSKSAPDTGVEQRALGTDVAQMVYGYTFRFALPVAAITQAQDLHIAQCDRLGPARCRLQEMHRSAGTSDTGGSIQFVLARNDARPFGEALLTPVRGLQGKLTSRDFEAEDVSKQIADAQVKVADKNTAANRSAVSDARAQVETSKVWVYYSSTASFGEQTAAALAASGETLTYSVVALIYFLSAALPWAVVLLPLVIALSALNRWLRRRFPRSSEPGFRSRYRSDADATPATVTHKDE